MELSRTREEMGLRPVRDRDYGEEGYPLEA